MAVEYLIKWGNLFIVQNGSHYANCSFFGSTELNSVSAGLILLHSHYHQLALTIRVGGGGGNGFATYIISQG